MGSLRRRRRNTCSAQNFVAYHQRPPAELGEQEVREFLLYLVNEKKTGSATQHMYIAAIKFLYATTLARPEVVANIPWPKRSQILPDILTVAGERLSGRAGRSFVQTAREHPLAS